MWILCYHFLSTVFFFLILRMRQIASQPVSGEGVFTAYSIACSPVPYHIQKIFCVAHYSFQSLYIYLCVCELCALFLDQCLDYAWNKPTSTENKETATIKCICWVISYLLLWHFVKWGSPNVYINACACRFSYFSHCIY